MVSIGNTIVNICLKWKIFSFTPFLLLHNNMELNNFLRFPVSTGRLWDVFETSMTYKRRLKDVFKTSCVHWVKFPHDRTKQTLTKKLKMTLLMNERQISFIAHVFLYETKKKNER